ncbi:MAG: hypothetical protein KKB20_07500 [Proteobacteria bacterium]|nr:hypothetical protein [Pseudomonadota bacterium]
MNRAEALRSIRNDFVEYIQKKVAVDFDNSRQAPLSFVHGAKRHVVGDVLGRFSMNGTDPSDAYLVRTVGQEVFLLYFQCLDLSRPGELRAGSWILSFRIYRDNELMAFYRRDRKIPVDLDIERVVAFHGHLCPDLILGAKLCEYVARLLSTARDMESRESIIAENRSSALDAIQVMLGATVGNQRLCILDFGKHNYTVLSGRDPSGLRFSLKHRHHGHGAFFKDLDHDGIPPQVMLDDVVRFQALLDNRVLELIGLAPEELFEVSRVAAIHPPIGAIGKYRTCCRCGQPVLQHRMIGHQGRSYCIPCFKKMDTGRIERGLN